MAGLESAARGRAAAAPGARSALALLLAINLFNYIDRYILASAEKPIRDEFFGDAQDGKFWMGTLATAFMVSYMVAAPFFGWLGDRVNRWWIVGTGVVLWSLASGGSGLAATFGMLLATRVFVGIGEAAYGPTAPTVIADLYPVSRRGSVLAWFYVALPVGSALGYALGGFASQHWGWRWAFYAVVAPGIVLGLMCFFRREPARGLADAVQSRRSRLGDYAVLLRTPAYILNTLGMTAMTFAIGGLAFWMPTYVYEFRGAGSLDTVSLVFGGVVVAAGLAATLTGGYLADRLTRKYPGAYLSMSGVGMLIGFPLFTLILFTPFPWAWVFVFLAVFMLFLNTGPTNTVIANVTHPAMRATAYAVNIFIIHLLGDAVSPAIIGAVADATVSTAHPKGNMNAAFLLVSLAILVSGVVWLLGARHLARDTARAPMRLASP